jgi:hypothetical protein
MGREESKDQAKTAQKEKEQANHAKKVVLPEPRKSRALELPRVWEPRIGARLYLGGYLTWCRWEAVVGDGA